MNRTNWTTPHPSEYCRRFQDEEYHLVNFLVTLGSIILYVLSCPLAIVMNALVIVAVKTRREIQSMSNIILACLAGTDLLVGIATLPASIAAETFVIADGSVTTYCYITKKMVSPLRFLSVLASLFHLPVISVDRYIALKYTYRYKEIVTKFRIAIAVVFAWFLAGVYTIFRVLIVSSMPSFVLQCMTSLNLLIIVYCHISVYFVSRRHEKQIRDEQIPGGEAAAKFREEKKAWKTTTVIIGCFIMCSLPGYFANFGVMFNLDPEVPNIVRPLIYFSLMLNSLCNPIIYCFRSKCMREAMIAVLKRQPAEDN